jgi:serine/threonine protein kinase
MQQQILDDRYEVDRLIGEGGMARVYIGRDRRLNRRVAIKIPRPQYIDDADFLNRFRHEALAAASLAHPAIVDVYDVGQEGSIHYIVMEYVDGFNLKALLNREAPLTVDRAVKLAIQVALGLHAAHRAGLVHRDIKPQNIIVTADGHARITDFGVAKGRLSTAFTETGVAFGTVDYLSPEQAQGIAATAQSDLYSLGVVLFEMLSGRLPFSGDTAVAIAMKHASEPPPSLCALNPHVPLSLERIVFQLLAKDPAQRPQSALAAGAGARTVRTGGATGDRCSGSSEQSATALDGTGAGRGN